MDSILWVRDYSAAPLTLMLSGGSPFGSLVTCHSRWLLEFFSPTEKPPGTFPLPFYYPQRLPPCLSPAQSWLPWFQMPCLFPQKEEGNRNNTAMWHLWLSPSSQRWADDPTRLLLSPPEVKWVPPPHRTAGKAEKWMILAMVGCTCHGKEHKEPCQWWAWGHTWSRKELLP